MVRVLPEEYAVQGHFSVDVFDGAGICQFEKGQPLPDCYDSEAFNRYPLYRRSTDFSAMDCIYHEGRAFIFETSQGCNQPKSTDADPVLKTQTVKEINAALIEFFSALDQGKSPDFALCTVARNQLIAAVSQHVSHLKFTSQLRVRDEVTYSHVLDVTALSTVLAIKLGFDDTAVADVALAAMVHDLGKLMIPYSIMFKSGKLTEKEFQIMQLHPQFGYDIITKQLRLADAIARPALEHQEMYGGSGYPQGLSGDEIHPYSHIVKIADVYDALTSKRPYKRPLSHEIATKIMRDEGSQSFHPDYLDAFLALEKKPESNGDLQDVKSGKMAERI
ncbi:MAG: HD-GYP domain-containing protein [Cyanobacteria bacterium P01_H01_bin.74]